MAAAPGEKALGIDHFEWPNAGVLDRFDGFLFTLPAVYYLMQILEPWLTK
jgi:hypothetical protein